ncbi:hypothetical protein C8A00DRAFT_36778, partial [Chaetomidium leptoderma]
MSTHIADCEALIEEALPALCADGAYHVSVETTPGRVVESYPSLPVALYAQGLAENAVIVNLMMPRIRAFLKRLASNGVGSEGIHDNVRYRFLM